MANGNGNGRKACVMRSRLQGAALVVLAVVLVRYLQQMATRRRFEHREKWLKTLRDAEVMDGRPVLGISSLGDDGVLYFMSWDTRNRIWSMPKTVKQLGIKPGSGVVLDVSYGDSSIAGTGPLSKYAERHLKNAGLQVEPKMLSSSIGEGLPLYLLAAERVPL